MSDAADLAAIMADDTPDSFADAPEPTDGLPPEERAADASEGDVSPEDHIADALRAGMDGDDEDDEQFVASDEPSGADPNALADEAMQWRQWHYQNEAYASEQSIIQSARQQAVADSAHYVAEEERLLAQMEADAEQMADPEAYKRANRGAIIQGVRAAERAWLNGIQRKAEADLGSVREARAKPLAAVKMAREYGLPDAASQQLLQASTFNDMRVMAGMLSQAVARNRSAYQQADQTVRAGLNQQLRANNVHPGSTGRPKKAKPYRMVGTGDVGLREIKSILSGPD